MELISNQHMIDKPGTFSDRDRKAGGAGRLRDGDGKRKGEARFLLTVP